MSEESSNLDLFDYFNSTNFFGQNYDIDISEDFKDNLNIIKTINKIDDKENLLLQKKRKAESAKRARQRRKLIFNTLIKENKKLKEDIENIKKKLHLCLCQECKKKMNFPTNTFKISQNTFKKKCLFTITSIITLFYIIFSFLNFTNLTFSIIKYSKNKFRKLLNYPSFSFSEKDFKNINLTSDGMYITLGDYYSIINKKKNFLDNEDNIYYFFNKGIKLINENELDINQTIDNCKNCLIQLEKNQLNFDENNRLIFSLFIKPNKLIRQKLEINYENNENNITIFKIQCLGLGYSTHKLFINKTKS